MRSFADHAAASLRWSSTSPTRCSCRAGSAMPPAVPGSSTPTSRGPRRRRRRRLLRRGPPRPAARPCRTPPPSSRFDEFDAPGGAARGRGRGRAGGRRRDASRSPARCSTTEAEAIRRLVELLGEDFERAVDLVVACTGRVVWTGMGKSGIICRKLAATMRSTGTPALFLHPAEAIHGDLGMVTERRPGDRRLQLRGRPRRCCGWSRSSSGSAIPLIAMTSHPALAARRGRRRPPRPRRAP